MSEDSSAFVALSSRRECKITRDYIGFSLVKGRLPYSCKKKNLDTHGEGKEKNRRKYNPETQI